MLFRSQGWSLLKKTTSGADLKNQPPFFMPIFKPGFLPPEAKPEKSPAFHVQNAMLKKHRSHEAPFFYSPAPAGKAAPKKQGPGKHPPIGDRYKVPIFQRPGAHSTQGHAPGSTGTKGQGPCTRGCAYRATVAQHMITKPKRKDIQGTFITVLF